MAFKKIVAGTDGSAAASVAVAHALRLARSTGAELLVVHGASVPVPTEFGVLDPTPVLEAGRTILAREEERSGSVRIRYIMREEHPSDALIDVAQEEDADLIVVGNRGMMGSRFARLGSVPNRVSHHAACSILIVTTTG